MSNQPHAYNKQFVAHLPSHEGTIYNHEDDCNYVVVDISSHEEALNEQGCDRKYIVVDISSLKEMMNKPGKWIILELPRVWTQEGRSYAFNAIAYAKRVVTNGESFVDNCLKKLKVPLCFHRNFKEARMNNQGRGYAPADKFFLETYINDEGDDHERVTFELPKVQTQKGKTCVFNAIASTVEVQLKGVVINVDSFVNDYTKEVRVPLGSDQKFSRVIIALEIIQNQGVIANHNGQEVRVRISGYECLFVHDYQVFDMIEDRIPLMGTFPVREDFDHLGGDIYEMNPPLKDDEPATATHIVMFVGYGERKGRPYLVFQNSYGVDWGTQGLGRVYFDQVYQLSDKAFRFITVEVCDVSTPLAKAPSPPFSPPGRNASGCEDLISPDHPLSPLELTHQPDDKPPLRLEIPFRSAPGQAYANLAFMPDYSHADDEGEMFTKNVKYETGYELLTSETWGDDASTTRNSKTEAAVTNNDLMKSSEAYQIFCPMDLAKVKQLHLLLMPESKPDSEMTSFSTVFTPYCSEAVLSNLSELCVEKEDVIPIISSL